MKNVCTGGWARKRKSERGGERRTNEHRPVWFSRPRSREVDGGHGGGNVRGEEGDTHTHTQQYGTQRNHEEWERENLVSSEGGMTLGHRRTLSIQAVDTNTNTYTTTSAT